MSYWWAFTTVCNIEHINGRLGYLEVFMFTVYHSNRLDILKDLMVELIAREPLTDPFQSEYILVQSSGMEKWLRFELASAEGIVAGIEFTRPASFIWMLFTKVFDTVPNEHFVFNKETLLWIILDVLPSVLDQRVFKPLCSYVSNEDSELHMYQLAERIADIFDQYLVYRSDWILAWEKREDIPEFTRNQPWQPVLWRKLVEKVISIGCLPWHRSNMFERLIVALNNGGLQPSSLPSRLFVLGVVALPPNYISIFHALGKCMDVHFMVTNPCQHFWGDLRDLKSMEKHTAVSNHKHIDLDYNIEFTNPLLASMGKVGRDYLDHVQEFESQEIDAFVDPNSSNELLQMIQSDIFNLYDRTDKDKVDYQKTTVMKSDKSLMLHSCHSPMREVEILHDQLLDLFNNKKDLKAADVVVMMPDINLYSPFIRAVFSNINGPRFIPWSISDQRVGSDNTVLDVFYKLFHLNSTQATSSELMEILETAVVSRRFNLSVSEFDKLRCWVDDVGIRCGLYYKGNANYALEPKENTWLFGISRMLLGYAMPSSDGVYKDIFPFDDVQGLDASLVGILANYIEQVKWLINNLDEPRSIDNWILFVNNLIERFFDVEEEDHGDIALIQNALGELKNNLQRAVFSKEISRSVMEDCLKSEIGSELPNQNFLTGSVVFCTLMPMRSIPFRVVCLLGMNDGAYPRNIPPVAFDLIASFPRRGDRSRREDDRYLFLEALLSAQEVFYISFVGKSVIDNSDRSASVLVSELLTYCEGGFCLAECEYDSITDWLITNHRLHPFCSDYFVLDSVQDNPRKLFSFAEQWMLSKSSEKEQNDFLSKPLPKLATPEVIDLSDLLKFYINPCKFFFNETLNVYFDNDESQLIDSEPFSLKNLESWYLRERIFNDLRLDGDESSIQNKIRCSGQLPHKNFGDLVFKEESEKIAPILMRLKKLLTSEPSRIEVDFKCCDIDIQGWLDNHSEHGLLRYKSAELKEKHFLSYWIEHLCYCIVCEQGDRQEKKTEMLGVKGFYNYPELSKSKALSYFEPIVNTFLNGQTLAIPLFAMSGWAWLKKTIVNGELTEDKASLLQGAKNARNKYLGGLHRGECQDDYMQRAYPVLNDELWSMQLDLTKLILMPAYKALQKGGL